MSDGSAPSRIVGRYAIYDEIASGGMATVHFGRLLGAVGFSRAVAIKCLHAHLAKDPEFVKMFLDEARVAARIRHPNVVPTLDVVSTDGQLFLVMEYVQGESLARLMRAMHQRGERIPVPVACSVMVGMLQGLHAAHEATDERGEKLGIVHRDVSPQNVIVGRDGVAHVLDFGVAKAAGRTQTTRDGQLKGKLAYMAAEQVRAGHVTRAADIYSAGVVLWEMLVGARLFHGENEANVLERVLYGKIDPPSARGASVPAELDQLTMRALSRDPARRFATAREMARAVEAAVPVASASEVSEWVEALAGEMLNERQSKVIEIERSSDVHAGGRVSAAGDDREPELAARSPRARGRVPWIGAVALAVVAVIAVAAVGARRATIGARSGPPADSAVAASMRPTVTSSADSAAAPGASVPVPADGASGQASASPPAPALPATPQPTEASHRRRGTRPPAGTVGASKPEIVHDFPGSTPRPPHPRPGCNPPYTIDAQGVKQYKVQCL